MLDSLLLRNFQRHRKFLIQFDPYITTIVGQSDIGKSTLLRGLKWVALNLFDGPSDELIHWDADWARGVLGVDEHEIIRRKGKVNAYKLDGKDFRAFGASKVPEPVANVLRLVDANFQNQLDAHFWFSQSPGEVSRQLNQIVNLGAIDDTLSVIVARSKKSKIEVEVCEKRLAEAIQLKKSLDWVTEVDRRLERIEAREDRIEKRRRFISSLTSSVATLSKETRKLKQRGSVAARASQIVATGQRSLSLEKRTKRLAKLIDQLEDANKVAGRKIGTLPDPMIVQKTARRLEQLQSLVTKLQSAEEEVCEQKKQLELASKNLRNYTSNGICPVCGKSIKA